MQEEKVIQISRVPVADPLRRPEIVAFTSKTTAKQLLVQMAGQNDYAYVKTAEFLHPSLPGLERQDY